MRILCLLTLCLTLVACNREVPILADTIYTGGTIYTGKSLGDTVEAVAVGEGLIVYAGDRETAIKLSKDGAKFVNLDGAVMYPGFINANANLFDASMDDLIIAIDGAQVPIQTQVFAYRDDAILLGRSEIPVSPADLDQIDAPFLVTFEEILTVNAAALGLADITAFTRDIEGGNIERDRSGKPTGRFEGTAKALFKDIVPSVELAEQNIEKGYQIAAFKGWTGLINSVSTEAELDVLSEMTFADSVPLRTYNLVTPDLAARAADRSPSGRLMQTRAVKIALDEETPDEAVASILETARDQRIQIVFSTRDLSSLPRADTLIAEYTAEKASDDEDMPDHRWRSEPRAEELAAPLPLFLGASSESERFAALKALTEMPAYTMFQEDMLGTIETGNHADFTVLDTDILTASEEKLALAQPVMTITAGHVVWPK